MKLDRDKLLRSREMLGYGVEKTAEVAGVSKNSVLRAEHEEDIRPGTARKIAAALGVQVADLVQESETLKVPAPREEIYDPRASELRRDNYLMALALVVRKCGRRWEAELQSKLNAPTPDFFAWAWEVMRTGSTFAVEADECDVFSFGLGELSAAEESTRTMLVNDFVKVLKVSKQILAEWDSRIEAMKDEIAAETQRQEMERLREEFKRIIEASYSKVPEHAASG